MRPWFSVTLFILNYDTDSMLCWKSAQYPLQLVRNICTREGRILEHLDYCSWLSLKLDSIGEALVNKFTMTKDTQPYYSAV